MKFKVIRKMFLLVLSAVLCGLLAICCYRTLINNSSQRSKTLVTLNNSMSVGALEIVGRKADDAVDRFSRALQFKTVSTAPHVYDKLELKKFVTFIKERFSTVTNSQFLDVEFVNDLSILITVKGSNPELVPYLLAGHLDVVPVDEEKWSVPPFSGMIKDGFIHGRGAIDIKCIVMSVMEALDALLQSGFQPKRSFYIAFGHDEEVLGEDGAGYIADTLRARGVRQMAYVLDEGLAIMEKAVPGVEKPVAMVGVTEKGFANIKLEVELDEAAITILSKAISKFHSKVQPTYFGNVERDMMNILAPEASFPFNIIYSNLWLFSLPISFVLSLKPSTNALIRTTTAVTLVKGGVKDNVLPSRASAIINHRIHPYQKVSDVVNIVKNHVTDSRVKVSVQELNVREAHPISDYSSNSFAFNVISDSLNSAFSDVIVSPGTLVGSTDTKYYLPFTSNVYRCVPVIMSLEDTKMVHGHNEKILVDNYLKMIQYYVNIMLRSDA